MVEMEEEDLVVKSWQNWALAGKHRVDEGVMYNGIYYICTMVDAGITKVELGLFSSMFSKASLVSIRRLGGSPHCQIPGFGLACFGVGSGMDYLILPMDGFSKCIRPSSNVLCHTS